ncbi:hypothetical protein DWF04_005935 [Cereibacter sphaeroides f. sp. denitrificans]|nr:hypothetical protein DWF04_06255 [Cereibacter sphaeroides f. sp. denitrificans]
MIRQPSSAKQLYAWWNAALSNPDMPRHEGIPEAGFYKTRLCRGGPWVPVRLYVEREIDPETGELLGPERIVAECEGERRRAEPLWLHLQPISRAEFDEITERPASIPCMAATRAAVDLTATPMRPF